MKYKLPKGYTPKIPENDQEAWDYNRWWINHVESSKASRSSGKAKADKAKQAADRKRFFIIKNQKEKAANKNAKPKYSIPTSSQHQEFFKNHQGARQSHKPGGKAKQKTKHLESSSPQRSEDPLEGPAPKQSKPNPPAEDPDILEKVMSRENDIVMGGEPDSTMQDGAMDFADGPDGAGGSGGGGGIGHSTGNWTCDTIWGSNSCTTYASRHCVCLLRDQDTYQLQGVTNRGFVLVNENATPWAAISTPWNYIDFNQNCIHFSPRDWQHLVNNFQRWRPRSIRVKIFNIQVIQKTTTDTGVQYSNDLTGTIQIFADQEGRFPKILYPSQTTMMGNFPNCIYYLPQYAYMLNIYSSYANVNAMLTRESAFYCLDEASSEMLRTGNSWESTYQFDKSTGWISNKHSSINIGLRQNPLYDTWETNAIGDDAKRGNFGTWRSPWYPGPQISLTDATAATVNITQLPNISVGTTYIPLVPGPSIYRSESDKDEYLHTFWAPNDSAMNEGDIRNSQISASTAQKVQVNTSSLYNTAPRTLYYTASGQGAVTDSKYSGMMPGMIWDNRPATYFDPIWQGYPETDEQFKIVSQLGGIPMNHCPGHIFVKLTPKPTGEKNSLIDQYATFTTSVEIEWELEPMNTHRWNMRPVISYETRDAVDGAQLVDANGKYSLKPSSDRVNKLYTSKIIGRTN